MLLGVKEILWRTQRVKETWRGTQKYFYSEYVIFHISILEYLTLLFSGVRHDYA